VIGLIISGGHTLLIKSEHYTDLQILGTTVDDAVGESFDKVAKMLDLGYPGGPIIEKTALSGNPNNIEFPKPMINDNTLNFSFSGLKTSVYYYINKNSENLNIPDICAGFQKSVFEVLLKKTIKAINKHNINTVVVGGGVAANKTLKQYFLDNLKNKNVYFPKLRFCTDNAAMIAGLGFYLYNKNTNIDLQLNPNAKIDKNPIV
jgi:N6-L-threonylcarbamoyladenine synthase